MSIKKRFINLVIGLYLLISHAVIAQQVNQIEKGKSWKEVDQLFSNLDNENSPAVSIAITWNHKPVYIQSYGMADIENKVKATHETSFNLASLTKQFTAYGVLLLAQQGKLSMEDPITKYLPELSFHKVSIRQLMNQTSGIPSDRIGQYGSFSGSGRAALLKLYAAQTLANKPGTRWAYNNNNYSLLSIIIERVSGKVLPDFLYEEVFIPLGMKQSYFPFGPGATKENRAYGYRKRNKTYTNVDRNDVSVSLVGAGGMYASISDLMRWDKALYSKNKAAKERWIDGTYLSGKNVSYGAGVNVSHKNGVYSIEHGGTSGATSTYIAQYPEYGASIIVLVASNYFHSTQGAKTLTQQIRQELFKRFIKTSFPKIKKQAWTPWSPKKIKATAGNWFGELNGTLQQVSVKANDNNSLKLTFFDGFEITLHQVGKDTFKSEIFTDILVRIQAYEMHFLDEQKVLGAMKKIAANKPNTSLINLSGNYTASALNNSIWTFATKENTLTVTNPSGKTYALSPIFSNIVGNTKSNIYFEQKSTSNDKKTWVLLGGQIPKIELQKTNIQQAIPLLIKAMETGGSDAAWKQFYRMQKQMKKFDFSERALNRLGYALLRKKLPTKALAIFQMMVKIFPASSNAYDSLADGFLVNDNILEAKKTYQTILKLDPNHTNALRMLTKLNKAMIDTTNK